LSSSLTWIGLSSVSFYSATSSAPPAGDPFPEDHRDDVARDDVKLPRHIDIEEQPRNNQGTTDFPGIFQPRPEEISGRKREKKP